MNEKDSKQQQQQMEDDIKTVRAMFENCFYKTCKHARQVSDQSEACLWDRRVDRSGAPLGQKSDKMEAGSCNVSNLSGWWAGPCEVARGGCEVTGSRAQPTQEVTFHPPRGSTLLTWPDGQPDR